MGVKNYEQYKRIIRFLSGAVLVLIEMFFYLYTWLHYYNNMMEVPYNRTGHWLIAVVYGMLLLIFAKLYGGLKIGYLKTTSMIC